MHRIRLPVRGGIRVESRSLPSRARYQDRPTIPAAPPKGMAAPHGEDLPTTTEDSLVRLCETLG